MLISSLSRAMRNDYVTLVRFLAPLAFAAVAVDVGDQFLNHGIARTANVVETLAAFGLAFVTVKLCIGALGEVRHAGLVLVQDRPGFHKILLCVVIAAGSVSVLLIVIAKTQLGVWLIEDLHQVNSEVSSLTHSALIYLAAYPVIDAVSWYHAGVLLRWHHSTLVGAASLADITAEIISVAILLYTPLVCTGPIAVPILALYGGVTTRCTIVLVGFYCMVYPKLQKERLPTSKVTVWKLVSFLSPLMLVLSVQRISRPLINLLVARFSPSETEAAEAVAVLTVTYPLGHLPYGWLNQLKPISPAFHLENLGRGKPVISGKKIAIFTIGCLVLSAVVSLVLFWVPGISLAILEQAVGLPHDLALLSVNPLKVFAFFCYTVAIRASLTGWLTLHRQTKLVAPSALVRVAAILTTLFVFPHVGVTGALMGVLALFSGFFSEMNVVAVFATAFACWKHWKAGRRTMQVDEESFEMQSVPEPTTDTSVGPSVAVEL